MAFRRRLFWQGGGFGSFIGGRPRIEATYLEIFYKQGLIGLLFWGAVFAFLTRDYLRASRSGHRFQALPYFLSALFVFIESATNPFLTNPIGMAVVLLCIVATRVLTESPQLVTFD